MQGLAITGAQRRRLERQLKQTRDVRVYRRTLAVLERASGRSVTDIARMLRVSRRSVHRWIDAYTESSDPDALLEGERPGRPRRWSADCSDWLESLLSHSPTQLGYPAVNWTVPLLQNSLSLCTGEQFCSRTLRCELWSLGYVWKRPRYVLAPDPEREKKTADPPRNPAFAVSLCAAC